MFRIFLLSFLFISVSSFAQETTQNRIKSELVQWDAVRGEWLAESFNAMSNNQPIPDRTFPEDLTPIELFSMVPAERQENIRAIINEEQTTPREPQTNQAGTTRIPVGGGNNQTPTNQNERYRYYTSRNGCELTMGRSYGDPHIRTFDGNSFSFQTAGEYILSSSPDRTFEVQARQQPQSNDVSLNTAVAMNVYGDRVGIYASNFPDAQSSTPIRVNGRAIYLSNETYYLPRGGTIQNTGQEYVVTWPTGEKVQAKLSRTSGMRFMNLSVFVYKCNGNYYGVMGNANGRSSDDFSGNQSLASSTMFQPFGSRDFGSSTSAIEREQLAFLARDYANQFRVNDQNTLFDYEFGQSSWTFYDPSFPRTHLTLGDISQSDRDRARRECERQGILADDMAGCVMDFAHANIPPSPRPTPPNRTDGRELPEVTNRKPNVNRPDVFERVPAENGRTGSTTRTPANTSVDEGGTRKPTIEDNVDRQVVSPDRKPVEDSKTIEPTRTKEPVNNSSNTNRKPQTETVRKPVFDNSSSKPTRTNSGTSTSKPQNERGSQQPSTKPTRTDTQISKPSTTPQPSRGKTGTSTRSTSSPSRSGASSSGSTKSSGSVSSGSRSGGR